MRLWPFKRKAPHPEGSENGGAAYQAKIEAQRKLREAEACQAKIDETAATAHELRRRNNFGAQMDRAFRRAT